jgi:L-2-hydroxyglutarate oxidase LhgO
MDEVAAVVVGAGVIGLAVARELAQSGRETVVLEAARAVGLGASSRNSEVLHAGIYYPHGSLKARLCRAGQARLYDYCAARGIGVRRCGKLIVATEAAQLAPLAALATHARGNGVELAWLERDAARALEPALECRAALHSPASGIIDSGAYLAALRGDAEAHGALIVCRSRVTRIVPDGAGLALGVNGAEPALRTPLLINCAGTEAPALARAIEDFPAEHVPAGFWAKGSYFDLNGRAPFARLIYPLPEGGGLGIHLTLDLSGAARFGPDFEWVTSGEDLQVQPGHAARFAAAIRRYWPALDAAALSPGYAGIRARIEGPGQPAADFRIDDEHTHGMRGILKQFGIESPGLTASLALASEAVERLG